MESVATTHIFLIAFSFGLASIAAYIAYQLGFFAGYQKPVTIPWQEALKIFLLFIGFQFLLFPLIASVWLWQRGDLQVTPTIQGWWNIAAIGFATVLLTLWCLYKRAFVAPMFKSLHLSKDFGLGIVSWLIAYPIVLLLSQIVIFILGEIYGLSLVDQLAVRQIRDVLKEPVLLFSTLLAVLIVVPILEELLFRGFLQGALRNFFGPLNAIVICSLIFAAFHFSLSQGINNLTIVGSLFILSLFLGYLKERQANLFAPIALHMTFNAISVAMILAQFS